MVNQQLRRGSITIFGILILYTVSINHVNPRKNYLSEIVEYQRNDFLLSLNNVMTTVIIQN